ncbi:hypothetical protein [Methylobrevis pamukkalensis]|uniref:hypothetical protein n=1 Tax=Methylobrevis pamukkalensis TaxID=1439726 RepID=UPI00114D3641|nr:hypothetical protein [Methylobrevis pamukkalensis]
MRAALRLAHRTGAAVDHVGAAHIAGELRMVADAGSMTTTLAEARNRGDLIVVCGEGARRWIEETAPFASSETPYDWRGERTLLCLGCTAPTSVAAVAASEEIAGDPVDLLRELKAAIGGRPSSVVHETAVAKLREARFGVFVTDPRDFDHLGLELAQALVKDLNETTRFTSISVPAPAHGRGANLVSAWTTGGRLRVGFGRGFPEQDDWRFSAERLVADGEADLLIWVGALVPDLPDYAASLPTIALVPPGAQATADVVIEVGVPGIHHDAVLTDAVRDAFTFVEASDIATWPSVATVLDGIAAALDAGRENA